MADAARKYNVNGLTGVIILLCIAVGLLLFFTTGNIIKSICIPVVIFGVYEILSSLIRNNQIDQFGTSESGAALFWGFVFVIIGGAGLVFVYADNLIFVAIFIVLIAAVYLVVRMLGNRPSQPEE